jgi:biopolymer transport protein ExbD
MRRSYSFKKLLRHQRKPEELLLVPMIDIFTVLVTFLLMTAVFSRTVIMELKLGSPQQNFVEPPPGLKLEVIIRKDSITVADRESGPLRQLGNTASGYNWNGLSEYLQFVKSRYQDMTEATILLEPDTPYDILVQAMDRTRVLEINAGMKTVQAELFPDVSIGDAPLQDAPANAAAAAAIAARPVGSTQAAGKGAVR